MSHASSMNKTFNSAFTLFWDSFHSTDGGDGEDVVGTVIIDDGEVDGFNSPW